MNKVFIAISIVMISISSYAQKIQGGLNGFSNLTWLKSNVSTYSNDGLKLGFSWGVFIDYQLAKNYFFSPSLQFLYGGAKLEITSDEFTQHNKYRLNYVSLPLTIKMKTNEIGYFTYFGQFGIDPSFMIKAMADIQTDSTFTSSSYLQEDVNVKSDMFPIRLALIVGLGCEYNFIGNTSLVTSVTFNNGFVNILKNNSITETDEHANMHYLALNVGIKF
jgi:hypothetical protein